MAKQTAVLERFFIQGAAPDENRFAAAKEREKKQWLEDLGTFNIIEQHVKR